MRCSAGYSDPSRSFSELPEIRSMCSVIAYPCMEPCELSVFKTSRSIVPCRRSLVCLGMRSPVAGLYSWLHDKVTPPTRRGQGVLSCRLAIDILVLDLL